MHHQAAGAVAPLLHPWLEGAADEVAAHAGAGARPSPCRQLALVHNKESKVAGFLHERLHVSKEFNFACMEIGSR